MRCSGRWGKRVTGQWRRSAIATGCSPRTRRHFLGDAAFQAAYQRGVRASAGVDPGIEWRVATAVWAASTALHVTGDFMECGVNAGFISSSLLHYFDWGERRFYLVDTFAGPPLEQFSAREVATGRRGIAEDALQAGAYVTDLERTRANFAEWPQAVIVQGRVPDVLAEIPCQRLAFLHLDMNCAYPERAALEALWPRMPPGAVVLLDDYAYRGHESQHAAIDEAAAGFGVRVLSLPTGQGLMIKPGREAEWSDI